MSISSLIPLALALICIYFSRNLSEEVPRLCAIGVAVLCCLLDLTLIPWQLQLALLLVAVLLPAGFKS